MGSFDRNEGRPYINGILLQLIERPPPITMSKKSQCTICQKNVRNLKRHLTDVHSAGAAFTRLQCGKAVDVRKGSMTLRCDLCQRRFRDLSLHISRRHKGLSKKARSAMVRDAKNWCEPQNEDACVVENVPPPSSGEELPEVRWSPPPESAGETILPAPVEAGPTQPSDSDDADPYSTESSSDEDSTDVEADYELPELIDRYQVWLHTFVGGDMGKDLAAEAAGKIRRMEHYGLHSVNRYTDGVLVATMFRELPVSKSWAPGTTCSYICAYKNFLEYLQIAKKINAERKAAASAVVTRIATAVYRQRRLRDAERAATDEETLLEGRELQSYQASEETARLEALAREGLVDNTRDYCRLRNHLMLRVCVANRQRAGAIASMTVEGLKAAKSVEADDSTKIWTIVVAFHKTAASHGPATIGLEEELFRLLTQFVDHIRTEQGPKHVDRVSGPLWLTLAGNKVSSKRISRCLQKAWRRSGQSRGMTTTILRKTAVTKGFEHDPTMMPMLGAHMSHSPAVQEKYYQVSQKRRNTANMTGAIKRAALPIEPVEVPPVTDVRNASNEGETHEERRVCLPGCGVTESEKRESYLAYLVKEIEKLKNQRTT